MSGTPDALRAVAERLERERSDARPLVASLRTKLKDSWDEPIPPAWRTLGFVQELALEAATTLEQDPELSCSLAQFAVATVSGISPTAYPPLAIAFAEGQAWKELGTAHRYLSQYDAALRAYDAARRSYASYGALAHELAIVDLARAVALSEACRFDEALELITATAPEFVAYHDHRRLVQGALLRAMIYHRRGDLMRARAGYEEALSRAEHHADAHTIASIHNNLGQLCTDINDLDTAARELTKARELFLRLSMPGEVARTDGALGRLAMQRGEFDDAVELFGRVRQRFSELGMIDEASVSALDIVEALVAKNHRDDALRLTETVLAECRAAGLNDRGLLALGYLRDLLPLHPEPQLSIRYVRAYLEQLRADPARVFLPLPE